MQLVKAPRLLKWLYPHITWHRSRRERTIFLSFDDGPIPIVTEKILDILKHYEVKATFFCVGENVARYPQILERMLDEGHKVGNHTQNHLNGWKHSTENYLDNVQKCQNLTATNLFRPPYGKITRQQIRQIAPSHEIIMWDVLSRDYDARVRPEQCLENVMKHTENGSIIVFHDHEKAAENVLYALPRAIEGLRKKGYRFSLL